MTAVIRKLPSKDLPSIAVGIAVFLAGFGMINVFWWLGDWREDVPGLWDYRSATIGDAILLPIAAAILMAAGSRLPAAPDERLAMIAAGAVGIAAGATLQVVWLLDPNPQPNWTLPAPHTLNAPGWYHAVFLVLASSFFSALTMRLTWRARILRRTSPAKVEAMLQSPVAAILVACTIGFSGLVAVDGYAAARDTLSSVAATATVSIMLAAVAALIVFGFGLRGLLLAWKTIGTGCLLAVALSLLTLQSPGGLFRGNI